MLHKQTLTLLTSLFFLSFYTLTGQTPSELNYPELQTNKTFQEAERLFSKKAEFRQSEKLYRNLFQQYSSKKPSIKAYLGLKLANTLCILNQTEEALSLMEQLEKTVSGDTKEGQLLLADLYTYRAKAYAKKRDDVQSLLFNDKAMTLKEKHYPPLHPKFGESYAVYSYVHSYLTRQVNKVTDYMAKEKSVIAAHPKGYPVYDQVIFYYNMTNFYSNKGEFLQAATQGKKTIQLLVSLGEAHHGFLSKAYTVAGNIYLWIEEPLPAIHYYEKAIQFPVLTRTDSAARALTYTSLGSAYAINEDFKMSIVYDKKALTYYSKEDMAYRAYSLNKIGENYLFNLGLDKKINALDSAYWYLQEAITLYDNIYPDKHNSLGAPYSNMGLHYRLKGEYEQSLFFNHQALVKTLPLYNNPSPFSIPTLKQCINGHLTENFLVESAATMVDIAKQDNNKEAQSTALKIYSLIDSIHFIKKKYSNDENAVLNNPRLHEDYGYALDILHYAHQQNPQAAYLQQAFQYMERVKGSILLKNLINMKQSELFGVPDSLIAQSQQISQEINSYLLDSPQNVLAHAQNQLNTDDVLFQLLQKKESLDAYLKKNYASYYQTRYQTVSPSLNAVQQQLQGHSLVEFYWTIQDIYVLYINGNDIKYNKIPIDLSLSEKIESHIAFLKNKADSEEDFLLYQQDAYELYNQLLQPLFGNNIPAQLIIIPDGPLSAIPFETLLTSKGQFETTNYLGLPYLLKSTAISYAYSTATLLQAHNKSNLLDVPKMLAFSFTDQKDFESGNALLEEFQLAPLGGAAQEVENLSNLIPPAHFKAFYGKKATREAFFAEYSKYNLLHLALHAQSDQNNRLNNRIFFHPKNNSDTTSYICYAHELYDLQPHPRLVVLGACNTGSGMNYKGEGIYSTARGFIYAGTPSVVMSLWPLSDQTSKFIITDFYTRALNGAPLDQAIQKAKLEFIAGADEWTAHPSKWAALNIIGSAKPIVRKKWNWSKIGLLAGALVIFLFVWYRVQRNTLPVVKGT